MRTFDVVRMATHNLWHRRARTLFNLTGIVTGCIVLLMTASGASGVRDAIHTLFDSSDFARQIYIFPGGHSWEEPPEGEIVIDAEISEARRKRIHGALVREWNAKRNTGTQRHEITQQDLDAIRGIPNVVAVVPEATTRCMVKTDADPLSSRLAAMNVHSATLKDSLLVGEVPGTDDREGVLINEFLAWQMGFQDDADLPKLVGQPLTIEYQLATNSVANVYKMLANKWNGLEIDEIQQQTQFLQTLVQLMGDLDQTSLTDGQKQQLRELIGSGFQSEEEASTVVVTRQFIVRGIVFSGDENPVAALFRQWFHGARGSLQINAEVATEIYLSYPSQDSFYNATVIVGKSADLRDVTSALQKRGFGPQSSLAVLDRIDRQIDRSTWIIYGIAIAILLTAAVGISNTLIMSIVERTPEFGIMKSVGARDSHVLWLMITEGAILGVVGAVAAILVSVLLGICGQSLLKMYVESQTQTELAGRLFQFQALPAGFIVLISITLCIIASLLPGWRAARLDPVVAMRKT